MARKRKSRTSINFTFKLNTLCLASILFLIKIYLRVHASKNYTTVEERQKKTPLQKHVHVHWVKMLFNFTAVYVFPANVPGCKRFQRFQ